MAPLLPLGFAILGLGCTIPLTIGGSELEPSIVLPSGDDAGVKDAGGDPGPAADAGSTIVDAGSVQDAGCIHSGYSPSYANCCTGDVRENLCNSAKQDWNCSNFRVCTYSGGSCFSTGHTCTTFADCCTEVCYKGFCAASQAPVQITLKPPAQSCNNIQEGCATYSDCCSQNCAFGQCVAPPTATSCGAFFASCQSSADCCSLECDQGNCRDNTLPPYLQESGSPFSSQSKDVQHQTEEAPRFQLNRVDDFAGQSPLR